MKGKKKMSKGVLHFKVEGEFLTKFIRDIFYEIATYEPSLNDGEYVHNDRLEYFLSLRGVLSPSIPDELFEKLYQKRVRFEGVNDISVKEEKEQKKSILNLFTIDFLVKYIELSKSHPDFFMDVKKLINPIIFNDFKPCTKVLGDCFVTKEGYVFNVPQFEHRFFYDKVQWVLENLFKQDFEVIPTDEFELLENQIITISMPNIFSGGISVRAGFRRQTRKVSKAQKDILLQLLEKRSFCSYLVSIRGRFIKNYNELTKELKEYHDRTKRIL